ncbi:type VI secretion protein [Thioclava sp. SK-1]|uniref:type VI secretion system membrane subunit TssM n=1 Tax=Thioclava sp. SK-1 TaxID=1889770 RepID=UPI0008246735|nr:type VI secretion system membrane subunit TssM [Thioclava sp. SK-1]OCX58213.1 type VI secretion protein [Thioclava sp. SK-1]
MSTIKTLWKSIWLRRIMIAVGLIAVCAAIWFGFPMTGWPPLLGLWPRVIAIGVIVAGIAAVYVNRWRKHRKRAKALEDSLMVAPVGDGQVLNERMQDALAKLRKSGGKTYLYDLPWYIIIGPPGAGKTTALANSGIEFPGLDSLKDHAQGFGGTRNCDWWFAEDAVLIDTAGRYTTQDSDAQADQASWHAFLDLLKKGRPDQPINGVMLAFSVEDMMNATEDTLAAHAQTVRDRLAEIHDVLKIDFPVYVLFTKADLIAGFREYFSSFSQSRRKLVWGTTFQTRDRAAQTWQNVPAEFDGLVARLSDEVIDRMSEEPDGISRVAIFGLPGQMAMLRDTMSDFLRRVFEPTRYKTNAILRGFYFTSGTQEGTPIDQVLGAMSRNSDSGAAFQPAFMSGKGKSYFLHDLLTKVIFAERDWVGFDRKAIARRSILRSVALSAIGVVTLALMAAFGFSFWQNASLLRAAEVDAVTYADHARNEIARPVIEDTNPSLIMPHLQALRQMTAGYGDPRRPSLWEDFGLSRYTELHLAADRAYSDGLERMLRPRMILQMENDIPQLIANDDTAGVYRALKVYLLLGGQGEGAGSDDDAAITTYFDTIWRQEFDTPGQFDERDQITAHLAAMLELDGDRTPIISIDPEIVSRAREAIVNLPLAQQAYASIQDRAATSGVPDFNLNDRISGAVAQVFETTDGAPLAQVTVPGLYTFEGYWGYFLQELTEARDRLREDQWVLGEAAGRVNYETQLSSLERELHRMYRLDFAQAWRDMLSRLAVARMSADPPQYEALAALSSPVASPMLELVEAVDEETRLTRLYDEIDALTPEQLASGSLSGDLGSTLFQRIYQRGGVFQRVVMDNVSANSKAQERVGGSLTEDTQRRQVERISDDFAQWHSLLRGDPGGRPVDIILKNLSALRDNRRQAAMAPTPADETLLGQSLSALTANNTALPQPLPRMLNEVETEFRAVAQDATMVQLNRALNQDVTQFCRDYIAPFYPFGNGRHISPAIFGQFFGPGGKMDSFYSAYLQPHVLRGANGLEPAPDSPVGQRLTPATLKQFDRAQAIQMAFFASGSPEPQVKMSVTHVTSSPTVQLSVLSVNGASIRTQPDSSPAALEWPGQSSGVSIELYPQEQGRQSSLSFAQGRWDIVTFLRRGRARVVGNVVDVTHDIGGRSITYRMEFDSTTVPFLMPELSDFSCPVSLE